MRGAVAAGGEVLFGTWRPGQAWAEIKCVDTPMNKAKGEANQALS
jgi:hypothetical protein